MIKLEVGQKVKFRNGQTGKVTRYRKIYPSDFIPYEVECDSIKHSVNLNEQGIKHPEIDGYESGYDVVEILEEKEEEEPMETKEIKVRYFKHDGLMYIQNVKESSIIITKVWKEEIVSVMDYGTPIKAKEQMYTYAKLFEVAEVKSH